MQVIARRAALAGAGVFAAASLASVLLLRKQPAAHMVLAAADEPAPVLHPIDALQRVTPRRPMPAVSFLDGGGASHSLAGFAGTGVVLNVWATWCAPCVAEMPALAALARKLAGSGIVVAPLSIDHGGAAAVRRFYAGHHIAGLGVWTDAEGDAGRALGVRGVPTTFVIDRQGREAAVLEGAADWGSDAAATAIRALV